MRKVYCFILVVVMSVCVMACGKKDDVVQTEGTQVQGSEIGDSVEQEEQEEDELEVILGVDGDVLSTETPESSTETGKDTQSSESTGKQEGSTNKSQDTQSSGTNDSTDKQEAPADKQQNTKPSGTNSSTNKQEESTDKPQDTQSSESDVTTEKQEESTEEQVILPDEPIELPFVPAT